MATITIKLTPSDPHWVGLGNGKYAVELADRWEARTPYADRTAPRPYIDIKIPELKGSAGGKIKIRWYSNDWHYIGIDKSADGVNFTNVWGRNAHYTFDEAYIIDLDPNCIYYRIHFEDGNLDYEVTGVYKDVEVEIYASTAPPQQQPGKFTIKLTPSDPHWVRLGNGKYAVELADRWEARTPYADKTAPRPYIDIKIQELQGSGGGKIKIRWYSNDWHYIGLDKSADGINFTNVWGRAAHYTFDEAYIIDLDPNCIYYRIHFEDGNLDYEVTGVYKDVEVEIYTPQPPSVSITKVAIWESPTGKEVTSINATDDLIKYWLVVYYNSTGTGTCTLTITVGGKTAWSGDVKILAGSGYFGIPFTWLAGGTIADLMAKYGITGDRIAFCAEIGNIRPA